MNLTDIGHIVDDCEGKSNRIEEIFGVKWYPYYVRNSKFTSLCDRYSENELSTMFNVCYNIPNRVKIRRFFAAFSSPIDFLYYLNQIRSDKWAFFEYILGDSVQKLYF